jgi:hypothetical protein
LLIFFKSEKLNLLETSGLVPVAEQGIWGSRGGVLKI